MMSHTMSHTLVESSGSNSIVGSEVLIFLVVLNFSLFLIPLLLPVLLPVRKLSADPSPIEGSSGGFSIGVIGVTPIVISGISVLI